jgi:hypothetical protein
MVINYDQLVKKNYGAHRVADLAEIAKKNDAKIALSRIPERIDCNYLYS